MAGNDNGWRSEIDFEKLVEELVERANREGLKDDEPETLVDGIKFLTKTVVENINMSGMTARLALGTERRVKRLERWVLVLAFVATVFLGMLGMAIAQRIME